MLYNQYKKYTINNSENIFKNICLINNIECVESSNFDNRHKHIDFYIFIDNIKYSVDVKAIKKIKRHHTNKQDNLFWIELINDYNNKGWIYCKHMDIVAFETNFNFILCYRNILLEYIEKILINEIVKYPTINKIYTRTNQYGTAHLTLIEKDKIPNNCIFKILKKVN